MPPELITIQQQRKKFVRRVVVCYEFETSPLFDVSIVARSSGYCIHYFLTKRPSCQHVIGRKPKLIGQVLAIQCRLIKDSRTVGLVVQRASPLCRVSADTVFIVWVLPLFGPLRLPMVVKTYVEPCPSNPWDHGTKPNSTCPHMS